MVDSEEPKFSCAACGREFRWKPEVAGKKAKCKCGETISIPIERPGAVPVPPEPEPEPEDPFAAFEIAGEESSSQAPAIGPPPIPAAAKTCPICGVVALPTAVMCTGCGYNFHTGQRTIGYGRPTPVTGANRGVDRVAAEVYQQAAKASWIAPLIAITLGCCAGGISRSSASGGLVIAIGQLLLILGGLGLGIFAFFGVKRNGPEGILAPAIIGVSLNSLIVAANILLFALLFSGRGPLAAMARARAAAGTSTTISGSQNSSGGASARMPTQAEAEAAFLGEPGWVGAYQHNGAVVTLVTVSNSIEPAATMVSNLGTPVSVAVLAVDNTHGRSSLTVDPTGGMLALRKGQPQPLPNMVQVLQTAKSDRAQALSAFSPPFTVQPGTQLVGKVIFLPADTDPKTISSIRIDVDGKTVPVSGRYITAEEKQRLSKAGSQKR